MPAGRRAPSSTRAMEPAGSSSPHRARSMRTSTAYLGGQWTAWSARPALLLAPLAAQGIGGCACRREQRDARSIRRSASRGAQHMGAVRAVHHRPADAHAPQAAIHSTGWCARVQTCSSTRGCPRRSRRWMRARCTATCAAHLRVDRRRVRPQHDPEREPLPRESLVHNPSLKRHAARAHVQLPSAPVWRDVGGDGRPDGDRAASARKEGLYFGFAAGGMRSRDYRPASPEIANLCPAGWPWMACQQTAGLIERHVPILPASLPFTIARTTTRYGSNTRVDGTALILDTDIVTSSLGVDHAGYRARRRAAK